MKIVKNTLLAFFLLSMVSCSNWLDIQPRTESRKEDMFKSQDGFREVLIGTYIRLKSTALYGGDLTFGAIEYLAQHWESSQGTTEHFLSQYQYGNAESKIENIYSELFKAIADVNGLLENIEARKDIFTDGNYELIKGEAIAIRAYCHFNILQLFGPVPQNADGRKILNYVKTVSNKIHPSYSFKEYTNLLIEDLEQAEILLKEVDPICTYSIYELNHLSLSEYKPKDDFWPYRQHRMNYYTVLGQKARLYQWIGNKQLAGEYAVKVIKAVDRKGNLMFTLGRLKDITNNDNTLSCEHILNTYIYNLKETTESSFSNTGKYSIRKEKMEEFVNASNDIRKRLWFINDRDGITYLTKKYQQKITLYEPSNVVPLMRISEMYLIAMESLPLEEMSAFYMDYYQSRNIEPPYPIGLSEDEFKALLLEQYHLEFYAEGKLFYTYKRMAIPSSRILWKPFSGDKSINEIYVLPLPKREIILK